MNSQTKFRIAIFASGSGTNAGAIMRNFSNDPLISVALVLTNNPAAGILVRCADFNVPAKVFSKSQLRDEQGVLNWLQDSAVTHIVLAGFLWLVPKSILQSYPGKIINIHPALLPKFGGKGMYGENVHKAVLAAGESTTGITIHEVNEHFDEGKILFQAACLVESKDSAETIAQKVHALEHAHFSSVIRDWILKSQ